MRALSVLAVIAAHAGLPGLPGGFTGVDVFFVISGFLITRLLLAEVDATGRIDLLVFWARRCRRLLPNAFAALIGTVLIAVFLFPGYDLIVLAREVKYAALEIANFYFIDKGVDYFGSDLRASPVLHFWSLSVEEQFYIGWPLLLSGLAVAFGASYRRAAVVLLAIIWCVSFALCVSLTSSEQPVAYFGTHTRCWQLATGALLAAGWLAVSTLPRLARLAMAWAGLAAIAASITLIDGNDYPGFWALMPTLGAAGLIAGFGAANPEGVLRRVLSAAPMQWIGERSYSWYLWHWPLLALPRMIYPESPWVAVIAIPSSLVLACAAYAWIETPLRKPGAGLVATPMRVLAATAAAAVLVIGIGLAAMPALYVVNGEVAERLARIRTASEDLSLPNRDGCHLGRKGVDQPDCLFGDPAGSREAVLWGDSHAFHWFAGVNAAAEKNGWRLRSWSKSACPSAEIAFFHEERPYETCHRWREAMLARLTGPERPDLVILSNATHFVSRTRDPVTLERLPLPQATQMWAEGFRKVIARLLAAGVQVVVIRDTPMADPAYRICLRKGGNCVTPREVALPDAPIDAEVARSFGDRVTLLDFTDSICDEAECPVMRNGIVVYRDRNHITASYAATFAPQFAEVLARVPSPSIQAGLTVELPLAELNSGAGNADYAR
jgi:peptidoglycan/LPS O-acetylase OafA/YrhL